MAYPSKTDRAAILAAAVDDVERDGLRALSLRSLAAKLDLAPNALYRYFADRSALESALSAESTRRLHAALSAAVGKRKPEAAIRNMAQVYLGFAREQRNLYEVMMMPCPAESEDATAHEQLWLFVVGQVARISGQSEAREAAVALWAFLHGITALESARIFSDEKPFSSFEFGLNAWVSRAKQNKELKEAKGKVSRAPMNS